MIDPKDIFDIIIGRWLPLLMAGLGIVSNLLCILVFTRQGYQESINISLAAIAVTDFLKCLIGFVHRVREILPFINAVHLVNWLNLTQVPNAYAQSVGGALANVFTMYVTFERCLSVSIPFKVKALITKRVTCLTLAALTLTVVASYISFFFAFQITWKFNQELNHTVAAYGYTDLFLGSKLMNDYMKFLNMFWPALTFLVTVSCTVVIIYHLSKSSQFRSHNASSSAARKSAIHTNKLDESDLKYSVEQELDSSTAEKMEADDRSVPSNRKRLKKLSPSPLSSKEAQLVKMLLIVVLMFVINLLPRFGISMTVSIEPEFFAGGKYQELYLMMVDLAFVIDYVNSSTNLFIYLAMSSLFREAFATLFSHYHSKSHGHFKSRNSKISIKKVLNSIRQTRRG